MEFMGYRRPYGRVGVRNHVLVMPGVGCADVAARRLAAAVPGVVYLANGNGCGQSHHDAQLTLEILSGLLANANVYGALIVGLGCEMLGEQQYRQALAAKAPGKPLHYVGIQEQGGLERSVKAGIPLLRELLQQAQDCRRTACDISELLLGLECGGSDPTSGLSANPVMGALSDRLVDAGGTTVISETVEAIGAEQLLRERGATAAIGSRIYNTILDRDRAIRGCGEDVRSTNPSPGNVRSGLSTLEEKSLGCIIKSGTRPLNGCYSAGQLIEARGALFMDSGSYDPISVTAKIAGGCQLVVFSTGMGNPIGSAVAPVLKITGNHLTYQRMPDMLDFDSSGNLRGQKSVAQLADELLQLIVGVCNGRQTMAELNGADIVGLDQHHMYP
ncbi:MAG: UxaA family hydrolase [Bacillota bacterium]|nr:UxaA family hydrolase [Bacillota bacterium]